MKNLTWISNNFAVTVIVCLCGSLGLLIASDGVSYQAEKQTDGINNQKTLLVDSPKDEEDFGHQGFEMLSLSTKNEVRPRPENSKRSRRVNTNSARERRKFNREEINSSLDTECAQADESRIIVDNKRQLEEDRNDIHRHRHLKAPERHDKFKRREKRDSQPVGSSSATPEASSEGTPEGSSSENPEQSWPEPEPEWSMAFDEWKDAWPLHTYGFAAVFTVIALIPLFQLLRMYLDKTRLSALKTTLLSIIFLFSSTRAFYLFVDPYGSSNRLPLVVIQLLFSLGHPCIISALSLLLLVLIDTTKMNIAPPRFQRVKFIIPVVVSHVAMVIVTDFVVVYFLETKVLLLICQIYFLLLGSLLAAGYTCVGWKIRKNIKPTVKFKTSVDNSMRRLQHLIIACAVTCVFICVLTLYAAAGVFGVYSDVRYVDAWPWWTLQTLNRLLEVVICIVVLLINKRGSKRKILPSFTTISVFNSRRMTFNVKQTVPNEVKISQSLPAVE